MNISRISIERQNPYFQQKVSEPVKRSVPYPPKPELIRTDKALELATEAEAVKARALSAHLEQERAPLVERARARVEQGFFLQDHVLDTLVEELLN